MKTSLTKLLASESCWWWRWHKQGRNGFGFLRCSLLHHTAHNDLFILLARAGRRCFILLMHKAVTEAAWSLCAGGGSSKHSTGCRGEFSGEFRQTRLLSDSSPVENAVCSLREETMMSQRKPRRKGWSINNKAEHNVFPFLLPTSSQSLTMSV